MDETSIAFLSNRMSIKVGSTRQWHHHTKSQSRHTQINAHFSVLIADFSFFFSLSRLNLLNFRVDLRHEE